MIDIPRLLAELQRWQGAPWHHQGRARTGVDCVGLLLVALAEQGVAPEVPAGYHPSAAGALLLAAIDASRLLEPRSGWPPRPGDVLVFRIRRAPQHLAVALAGDRMIHATVDGVHAVTIGPLWRKRLISRYGWA